MITILAERRALIDTTILKHGAHQAGGEVCAMELINLVVSGEHCDTTPACLSAAISAIPTLNDMPWWSDGQRTHVLRPFLHRLLRCARDAAIDARIMYRLSDHACRVAAPEWLDNSGFVMEANLLRQEPRIEDEATATRVAIRCATLAPLGEGAGLAAVAARSATVGDVEQAAFAAAEVALRAAMAGNAQGVGRHAKAVLEIICSEYERGARQ